MVKEASRAKEASKARGASGTGSGRSGPSTGDRRGGTPKSARSGDAPARQASSARGPARTQVTPAKAVIRPAASVMWDEPPAHYGGAFSKMLVRPEPCGSKILDYRISVYQPRAYVAPHSHRIQEQIYHVLEGEGLMEIEGQRTVVRRDDIIFIPPGVRHAIYNTGLADLRFIVVTSPPDDEMPETQENA